SGRPPAPSDLAPARWAALGVSYLAIGRLDEGIAALQSAAQGQPNEARWQSDLSAAYAARAERANRRDDWTAALAPADRALALRSRSPEALFNRALALDGLGQNAEADRAWSDVLALGEADGWAKEAADRQARLRARP